jgi:amidophosphoribosyltransferase
VDTPSKGELIGSSHSIEQIRQFVDADTLAYLPIDGLRIAVDDKKGDYCYACYTGDYPTDLVQIGALDAQGRL